MLGSSSLMAAMIGRIAFISRSCLVPKIFASITSTINVWGSTSV